MPSAVPRRCLAIADARGIGGPESEDLVADRVARDRRPRQARAVERHRRGPSETAEPSVGGPGHGVLLGEHQGHTPHDGGGRRSDARVTAEAQDDRWPTTPDDPERPDRGDDETEHGADVRRGEPTLDPATGQHDEFDARRGHERRLLAAFRTDPQQPIEGLATVDEGRGDREAGEDVAGGAAPGDDDRADAAHRPAGRVR
ncbi:MAG: hypothetical protein V9G12_15100 [Microthrixaceae bacterium]